MANITRLDQSRSVALVKQMAPFDSGNLRHNAIKMMVTPNGFQIRILGYVAPYFETLDSIGQHAGIFDRMHEAVAAHINFAVNQQGRAQTINYKQLANTSKDNPKRQSVYLNALSNIRKE